MACPPVIGSGPVVELHPKDRLALYRARDAFATALNALRQRQSLSPNQLATQAWLPLRRVQQLLTAKAWPAWNEVLIFAWLFKVPASSLVRSLMQACDRIDASILFECTVPVSRLTTFDCARKAYLLQKLASRHGQLLDLTLADWPALLPPTLADALAAESAVTSVNAVMVSECVDALKRACRVEPQSRPTRDETFSVGESLDAALEATIGASERLQALIRRHRLDHELTTPSTQRALVAQGIREVLADVQDPLTVLRTFEKVESTEVRNARMEALIELLPSLAIEDDHIDTADPPACLAHLSPGEQACATQMLSLASTFLSSISDRLRQLSSLATPNTSGAH